jgi:serine/threonine protein kinase
MLFILCTGKIPFYGAFEEDVFRKIQAGKFRFPEFTVGQQPVHIPPGAKSIIIKLLNVKRRPTASEVLQDPWLRQ